MSNLFLDALHCKNEGKFPVWMMRQAGRYMASYQELRKKYDFLTICHTPELISAVTLLPIEEFGLDAAIIFSDILLVLEGFGKKVAFIEGQGPVVEPCVRTRKDVEALREKGYQPLDYVMKGIEATLQNLSVPLIGFVGAPFTVASYLIEGRAKHDFLETKKMLFSDEKLFLDLLDILSEGIIEHANAQVRAGCSAIQIFDSWANVLPWEYFQKCSLHYMQKIVEKIEGCPTILFMRGSGAVVEALMTTGARSISFDWQVDLRTMRHKLGHTICIQGNLDPDILLEEPSIVVRETKEMLEGMRYDPGYIVNLGHGIRPETKESSVKAFIDTVRAF